MLPCVGSIRRVKVRRGEVRFRQLPSGGAHTIGGQLRRNASWGEQHRCSMRWRPARGAGEGGKTPERLLGRTPEGTGRCRHRAGTAPTG